MPLTSLTKDPATLSLTVIGDYAVPQQRLWEAFADPRQLERWWGPPNYPATFEAFDFQPGGRASYFMTSPDGTKPRGWWKFTTITAPSLLELDDGFADDNGDPVTDMGTAHMVVSLADLAGRTFMTITTTFESTEQMEQMVAMGMEEGMRDAMGQIDAILTE